jgi:glycosyltransferase involved in cell wall biosynthesis
MRGQTPVLVSDAAGNRDAVTHGVNGLVVAREDVRALGDWIITILRDPRLSDSLVRGALDRLDRFDVQGMARATSELYDELVMQRSGRGTAPVQLGVRHGAAVP